MANDYVLMTQLIPALPQGSERAAEALERLLTQMVETHPQKARGREYLATLQAGQKPAGLAEWVQALFAPPSHHALPGAPLPPGR